MHKLHAHVFLRVIKFRRKLARFAKKKSSKVLVLTEDQVEPHPAISEMMRQLQRDKGVFKIDIDNRSNLECDEIFIYRSHIDNWTLLIKLLIDTIKLEYVLFIKSTDTIEPLKQIEDSLLPVVCVITGPIPLTNDGDAIFYTSSRVVFPAWDSCEAAVALRPWLVSRSFSTLPLASEKLASVLDSLGSVARALKARTVADETIIRSSDLFDSDFYLGSQRSNPWRDAVKDFVKAYQIAYPYSGKEGQSLIGPCPGFDPFVYIAECKDWPSGSPENPFAHFLRKGKPQGTWLRKVTYLQHERAIAPRQTVAVHAHFFYEDLIEDFVARLCVNKVRVHTIITTNSRKKRDLLNERLRQLDQGTFEIRICANRGRDLAPFLNLLCSGAFDDYTIIGHFHSKQSPHLKEVGVAWRAFVWEHLLGGRVASLDIVTRMFAEDDKLGLVFAEDRHVYGWGANKALAEGLAEKMNLGRDLPESFHFPAGTMFWARPKAIRRLCALCLDPSDFPEEPLALDGTILHALERIITFVVEASGFSWATTYLDISY